MNLTTEIKNEYPFNENFFELKNGLQYHYLNEGQANSEKKDIVLMVHGNPTWSFYYRNLVKSLSKDFIVIAPDHIGCGLSEKPQNYDYTLKNHIDNLTELMEMITTKFPNSKVNLIVHDWGGAIGFGWAINHKSLINKCVILNTAAFTDSNIPKRISLCKVPFFGERLVRSLNAFAYPALYMAVEKPMSEEVKKGYIFPYNNYQNRIATARFVKDIPMSKDHVSFKTLKNIEDHLSDIDGEKLILWGNKDFCFTTHFYNRWREIYPKAKAKLYENGGHYILEDEKDDTLKEIKGFLIG